MNQSRRIGRVGRTTAAMQLVVCLFSIAFVIGCTPLETRFNIVTFREQQRREQFSERFEHGVYTINAKKNYEFAFELKPTMVEVMPEESTIPPASEEQPNSAGNLLPDEVWMSQVVHIEVFWKPYPGRTYAEKTQTNATIVYTLITGNDAISYEGTGFVYFTSSWGSDTVKGRIESATLNPVRQVGEPTNLFGPCHITGEFLATRDDLAVARAEQKMRRILGPPVTASVKSAEH